MENDSSRYPELKFISDFSKVDKHRNRLPHWSHEQTACFITFRLSDSIPATLLACWRKDRDQWLMEHPKPWSSEIEMEYHKKFSTRIDRWLDEGHGACPLANPINAAMVSDTLGHSDSSRYLIHSAVIMPNHVHVLTSPSAGESLPRIVANWKRFSATRIHKAAGTCGSLWQKDYFDRLIRDWDHFINVARYIRRNPQKAGLVDGRFVLYEAPWVKRLLS